MKRVAGSEMALTVLMFSCVGGSEKDPTVRIDDPVGPRLLRFGDGWPLIGTQRWMHPRFRSMIEKNYPGAYGFNVGRLVCMDDMVRRQIAAGLDQLVILGAGYDTRAYRMAEELRAVKVFEVDLPPISRDKRKRLLKAIRVIPENVEFVEVDFNTQELFGRLAESGYEASRRTLFVLCGVAMYLPEEAVEKLLSEVGAQGEGTSILFDYFFAESLVEPDRFPGAAQLIERTEAAGEKLRSGMSPRFVDDVLAANGLKLVDHQDMTEVAERYLRRRDGTLAAKPYGFAAVVQASAVG